MRLVLAFAVIVASLMSNISFAGEKFTMYYGKNKIVGKDQYYVVYVNNGRVTGGELYNSAWKVVDGSYSEGALKVEFFNSNNQGCQRMLTHFYTIVPNPKKPKVKLYGVEQCGRFKEKSITYRIYQ